MYLVYAVDNRNDRIANNALKEFGKLSFVCTAWVKIPGFERETTKQAANVFMLEFEGSNARLTTVVRYLLDHWGFDKKQNIAEIVGTDCPLIQHMLDTPDPTTPSLAWCVRRFKEYFPSNWSNYWHAVGQCGVVSGEFLDFMQSKGAISSEQIASGYAHVHTVHFGDPRSGSPELGGPEYHATVRIGNVDIDWTHRQYNAIVPVPYVRHVRDVPPHMRYCRICNDRS